MTKNIDFFMIFNVFLFVPVYWNIPMNVKLLELRFNKNMDLDLRIMCILTNA